MRIVSLLVLALCLTACNRGGAPSKEQIRQAIVERLKSRNMPLDVQVNSMQVNGNKVDAVVSVIPPGQSGAAMTMPYHLELKDGKWVVVSAADGGAPHPGAAGAAAGAAMPGAEMPGAENPHGGMAPGAMPPAGAAPQGGGKMPSPAALPPAGQKK